MQKALRDAAAAMGATVVVTDAHHDVSKQVSGIQSAVTSAHNAGVAVVAVDANASGPVDSCVGSENVDAGQMACEYLAKAIGGTGSDQVRIAIGIALPKKWGANVPASVPADVKLVDAAGAKAFHW